MRPCRIVSRLARSLIPPNGSPKGLDIIPAPALGSPQKRGPMCHHLTCAECELTSELRIRAMTTPTEQLAISDQDFRFYAVQSLGGGQSIIDMLQMIRRGFPSSKVIRLAGEYRIPETLLQKALHISPSLRMRPKLAWPTNYQATSTLTHPGAT
jgi:hypothetical protein